MLDIQPNSYKLNFENLENQSFFGHFLPKLGKILDFFKSRYGLWILREPPLEGFHLLAWMLPLGFLILGLLLLRFFFWNKSKANHKDRSDDHDFFHQLSEYKKNNI